MATNLCAGICEVTVTDNLGCTATASVDITQPPVLIYFLEITDEMDTICLTPGATTNITVSITGTPPFSISLYDGTQTFNYIQNSLIHTYPVYPTLPNTTYSFIITDFNGCAGTAITVSSVQVWGFNPVNAVAQTPELVCGNSVSLNATPVTDGNGWWTAPQEITFVTPDTLYNAEIFTNVFASYTLYWHVQNIVCTDNIPVNVTFFHPISPPNAGIDISFININSVILNASPPPYGTGNWSVVSGGGNFANENDAHTTASSIPIGENIYRWTVTNGPCSPLFDDLKIIITDLTIPEGFSPNSDGVNDFFEIKGVEFYSKSEFIVFNRWGIEVYNKNGYDNTWDGKSMNNKVLPEDTYFFVLKLDEKNSRKGYIILKR